MINTKLKEVLQTLQGLKEQANLAMQLLDDNIAVKLENTELAEIQSKINPKHIKVLDAYLSLHNERSYVEIDEKRFTEWWTQYEFKDGEDYTTAKDTTHIMTEIGHDVTKYKKDSYIPYGTYYSEYLEIELEMVKQSYPSDAKAMACFYDNIYIQEDGTLNYISSGHGIEDTYVEDITYKILPLEKRGLNMVHDTDYQIIPKEEFLEELKSISRRFDSLAYRIEDTQEELVKKIRKQNATTVKATVSLEDYKTRV